MLRRIPTPAILHIETAGIGVLKLGTSNPDFDSKSQDFSVPCVEGFSVNIR